MTKDEFLYAVRDTGYTWRHYGMNKRFIRTTVDGIEFCPVTAVCYYKTGAAYEPHRYMSAASHMGLDVIHAWKIADAADEPLYRDQSLYAAVQHNELKRALWVVTGYVEEAA